MCFFGFIFKIVEILKFVTYFVMSSNFLKIFEIFIAQKSNLVLGIPCGELGSLGTTNQYPIGFFRFYIKNVYYILYILEIYI